jgi:hypothetical protein
VIDLTRQHGRLDLEDEELPEETETMWQILKRFQDMMGSSKQIVAESVAGDMDDWTWKTRTSKPTQINGRVGTIFARKW